jgi:hypothetical protein
MTVNGTPKFNAARNLLLIHRIISRAQEFTRKKGQEHLTTGFPEAVVRQGYHDCIHCMVSVRSTHHLLAGLGYAITPRD